MEHLTPEQAAHERRMAARGAKSDKELQDERDEQVAKIVKARRVTELDQAIGVELAKARKNLGMSRAKLAKHIGVSSVQLRKYENGLGRIPASRLFAACFAMAISPNDLLQNIQMPPPLVSATMRGQLERLASAYRTISDHEHREILIEQTEAVAKGKF